jgi:hypothetical protein
VKEILKTGGKRRMKRFKRLILVVLAVAALSLLAMPAIGVSAAKPQTMEGTFWGSTSNLVETVIGKGGGNNQLLRTADHISFDYVGTGPLVGGSGEYSSRWVRHIPNQGFGTGHYSGIFTSAGGGTARMSAHLSAVGSQNYWEGYLVITGIDGDLAGLHATVMIWGTLAPGDANNYSGTFHWKP